MKKNASWGPLVWRWLWAQLGKLLDKQAPQHPAPEHKVLPPASPLALDAKAYATVIIPALNEAKRIADVVAYALADPATAEVIVIDDSSIDATAQLARAAGARVILSSMLGKGASMQDGIEPARQDLLVYLDGDLAGLRPGIITDLCIPLLRGAADFVKARFGRGGGRVTELTAKPMLKIFFPELAHISQPLGGIIAARKKLLQTLPFEDGYGVDVGILIDAHLSGARIAEVDIGSLEHDSQPLHDLTVMANEVSRVIFNRARSAGRLHVEQVATMYEAQRQAASGIDYVLTRRKGRQRLLLLDMDGTVTPSRFAVELAKANGQSTALMQLLDTHDGDASTRSENIARLFQYLHKKKFEQVARAMEIRPGVIEFVNQMRRRGFMVGVVSDSYFVAADVLRRRIFADFAMAHSIVFENEVCTGQVRINPAFIHPTGSAGNPICKSNVLRRFLSDPSEPAVHLTWVVGDNTNDLALMRLADAAFAIEPKSPSLMNDPDITVIDSFGALLERLPNHILVAKAA
ncbi:HAD-IB family phosphatase [Rhodoferax saidenbachensis]|nr:HAD-IB family phosphatase [Rhodoferax saidenbachensis]